jgi:hypothetical protein
LRNSIFSNGDLGIDLEAVADGADDRTANDPDDLDDENDGPNLLQNFPEITSAKPITKRIKGKSKQFTAIAGTLDSTPDATFTVRLFSNPSGEDEGKRFLGKRSVTTDPGGDASFGIRVARRAVPVGSAITATATDPGGNTSEFSVPKRVSRKR